MSKTGSNEFPRLGLSRRDFLATGLAAMSVESLAVAAPSGAKGTGADNLETIPTAPFDTLRD